MTFEELKSELAAWLAKDTDALPDATRGMIINLSMRELLRDHDLRFGEYRQSVSITKGTAEYNVPDRFSRPYELYYFGDDGGKTTLYYLTREEFTTRFGDNSEEGSPAYWTIWGDKLIINSPDENCTLYFDVYRLLADLADGSPNNTNEFVEYAWEAIFFKSLLFAALNLFEDERANTWAALSQQFERKLMQEHRRSKSVARRPETNEPG